MPNPPENGPSKGELRRLRIRRARIVTTVLAVVATVVLGVVLATSDPSRAASPTAARVHNTPTVPGTGSDNGYSSGDSGNSGRQFSNGDDGGFTNGGSTNNGGSFNSGSSNTQTHGS